MLVSHRPVTRRSSLKMKPTWAERFTLSRILWFAGIVRAVLILYAEWHDAHFTVKYTDIDYTVYTGACVYVTQLALGSSCTEQVFRRKEGVE
jgi:hypothetical protein